MIVIYDFTSLKCSFFINFLKKEQEGLCMAPNYDLNCVPRTSIAYKFVINLTKHELSITLWHHHMRFESKFL